MPLCSHCESRITTLQKHKGTRLGANSKTTQLISLQTQYLYRRYSSSFQKFFI